MGTRIVIKCRSQNIPGDPNLRPQTMANMVCRRIWNRDFDDTQDRVQSRGIFFHDGTRCFFLVDSGPPDSKEVHTSMYNWDGSCLTELPVSPIITSHLHQYPFNPANKEQGYTDEEYREKFGDEAFKAMMTERIRQKKRNNLRLFSTEKAFMQANPGLVDEV
ncbi:hypothetical protein SODALDRAFT_333081 [Sodiomyces alkalinus F11]|uniref:Uncharacterized protein n=1 Tax=Sodiomyces alkalinus (strain CBS 110278 / VKM F-3762 / F11) TaxID=1314773 RepID=A0A3N2PVI3_SODAK|nr:hypothetical protein SODALDRAFT_333081 [Sodiomyces alkalinus F11]ROT38488.1 hypothetical protein SODALDRAFT_333081 [Sodiomyces alkalinus F11]